MFSIPLSENCARVFKLVSHLKRLTIGGWQGVQSCPDEFEEQEDQEKPTGCHLRAIQPVFVQTLSPQHCSNGSP